MTADHVCGHENHDSEPIEAALALHREIRRRLACAWNPFFARFGTLRPIQLQAIPVILTGKDALLTAPTAGGKTEAAIAPLAERIIGQGWAGLSVLVITPTRALVNDLYLRLERPLAEMQISLARKTSDHPLSHATPSQILVTTPESTESLLTFRRELLQGIRAIVLDEIHLLDGTPRGDQLRIVLSRLRKYLRFIQGDAWSGIQCIGMSATVSRPNALAERYLGESPMIVQVGGQRDIEAHCEIAGSNWDTSCILKHFPDAQKVLVFVNSRKLVDMGVEALRRGPMNCNVFGHHGSLNKSEREMVEERFRNERSAICVATMTLEVGIDIGDVDLVVCVDPPFSLSSFLQRIGRGCRRLQGKTRVLCIARDDTDRLIFEALVQQARRGIPIGPLAPFRRSVLVQQVLAYLRQVNRYSRTADQLAAVICSNKLPAIPPCYLESVLSDMRHTDMIVQQNQTFCPASRGWEFIQSSRVFTNIQSLGPDVGVVDIDTGREIAKIAGTTGGIIQIAGHSYRVVSRTPMTIKVRRTTIPGASPQYGARTLPYGTDVGPCLRTYLDSHEDLLELVHTGHRIMIMTWLGRLLNSVLASTLTKLGNPSTGSAFALSVEGLIDYQVIERVKTAVEKAIASNPLGEMDIERVVDCGPYFEDLSPFVRKAARDDWLDMSFLRQWADGLKSWKTVERESSRARVFLSLACR